MTKLQNIFYTYRNSFDEPARFTYDETCWLDCNCAKIAGPSKDYPNSSVSESYWILPTPQNMEYIYNS